MGCLDSHLFAKREELLESKHPSGLFLELEKALESSQLCP
jgi:hypothetical protein